MGKKILFILPSLCMGGVEKLQVNIANALSREGHDVTVQILDDDRTLASELLPSVKLKYKPHGPRLMKKIPYARYKFYDTGLWETRASAKRMYKYYVGKEKYDVEIGFFRGLPIKIVSGSTNKNAVRLAWVHSDYKKVNKGYMANFRSFNDVVKAYKTFDKIVCVSNNAKNSFIEEIGDFNNLTTVYNFTPTKLVEEKSNLPCDIKTNNHKLNVIMVGRLVDKVKGQIRLISAVKTLRSQGLDVGLTLVGDGIDRKNIENFILDNGCQDFTYLLGNQANPYNYVKQADLLVCSSFLEGYNLTVAEALILDKPVLSTDCVGPKEILDNGKYGLIVDNSEQGLIDGLKKMYDKNVLNEYALKAKERKDFFNEQVILKQITELLSK